MVFVRFAEIISNFVVLSNQHTYFDESVFALSSYENVEVF